MPESGSAELQLASFMARYTPEIAARAEAALAKLRVLLPPAFELVYDNYNALAIGFAPSDKASHAIVSIALYPRWVTLFFLNGKQLEDPKGLLKGNGSRVRHIVLGDEGFLEDPTIRKLILQALEMSPVRFDPGGERRLIIKSVSVKQRPRRPG